MAKAARSQKRGRLIRRTSGTSPVESAFDEVLRLIETARSRAFAAANTELVKLYWQIGEYITERIASDGWGQGTVEALAKYIQARRPGASGYSARNLWLMSQFYETYRNQPKLSPLVTELDWTKNLLILGRCKREEEREFYLRICHRENWGKRELERQLAGALFERMVLSPAKLSPAVAELHHAEAHVFKVPIWNLKDEAQTRLERAGKFAIAICDIKRPGRLWSQIATSNASLQRRSEIATLEKPEQRWPKVSC